MSARLLYGQLVKRRRNRTLTFTLTRMVWGSRRALNQVLQFHGYLPNIQTAFIERVNLTIRWGVAPLARKTWALAQSSEHLRLHLEWWRLYSHCVRVHESLRLPVSGLHRRYQSRSPAMAAGVTTQLWSVGLILKKPFYPIVPAKAGWPRSMRIEVDGRCPDPGFYRISVVRAGSVALCRQLLPVLTFDRGDSDPP